MARFPNGIHIHKGNISLTSIPEGTYKINLLFNPKKENPFYTWTREDLKRVRKEKLNKQHNVYIALRSNHEFTKTN